MASFDSCERRRGRKRSRVVFSNGLRGHPCSSKLQQYDLGMAAKHNSLTHSNLAFGKHVISEHSESCGL